MIRTLRWGAWLTLSLTGLVSCVTIDPTEDLQRAREIARQAAAAPGAEVARDPVPPPGGDRASLEDGLTMEEAVRIALENSPRLRAIFQEVGVAHAEWVGDGLLDNPSFNFSVVYPSGGGRNENAFGIVQAITSLWLPTGDVAQAELDRAVLEAAASASKLARETREAFITAATQQSMVEAGARAMELAELNLDLVQRKADAGRANDADLGLMEAELMRAKLEIRKERLSAREARRNLAALLAMPGQLDETPLSIPEPAHVNADALSVESLLAIARQQRPDVRALEAAIAAAEIQVEVERRGRFPEVSLGPGKEKDDDGVSFYGGGLELTLPIFGHDRVGVAIARSRLRQLQAEHQALLIEVETDVANAVDRWMTSSEIDRLSRDRVLPKATRQLELEEAAYQGGSSDLLAVIEAQKDFIAANRERVEAAGQSWTARAQLMEAIAGEIPSAAPPSIVEG